MAGFGGGETGSTRA